MQFPLLLNIACPLNMQFSSPIFNYFGEKKTKPNLFKGKLMNRPY